LGRKIDELIRVPLSKKILFDRLTDCNLQAVLVYDQVQFVVEVGQVAAQPVVTADGYIVLDDSSSQI
jgi:hypothetical protein